jgi:hypothetical protein
LSRANLNVKTRNQNVNLRRTIARAVSYAPVKVVARDLDISPREVSTLRTQLGFPRVPTFLEIAKRDPALKAQVIAILSGDGELADPASIDVLVRFFNGQHK